MLLPLCALAAAQAHGVKAGDISLDHPYALPSLPDGSTGVYFRTLRNNGRQADRLLSASTPAAASVEIRRRHEGRSERLDTLALPPGTALSARHDGEFELRLLGLQAPLKEGDRVPLLLRFERAGEHAAMAWVQTPR